MSVPIQNDIDGWLVLALDRQDFLCRNVPRCAKCDHEQVQLIWRGSPAHWRCRMCKHRFEYEPPPPQPGDRKMTKPIAKSLWRRNPETPEGKYLIKRRDGTVVEWPSFVLGARDPAAATALRAYANRAMELGTMHDEMAMDIFRLADEFDEYREQHGDGDPGAGPHRKDDPETIAEMRKGMSA